MACRSVHFLKGSAIVCGPAPRARACSVCKRQTSEYVLCDFPIVHRARKTCDAVLCRACAAHRGEERDYCPLHIAFLENRVKF